MRASAPCALWMIGMLMLAASPAFAQDAPQTAETTGAELGTEAPLTPEESALLGNALVFDPAALATPPKKPLRFPGTSDRSYEIKRTEKPDGSTTVVVKQPLSDRMGQFGRRRSRAFEHGCKRRLRPSVADDARRVRRRRCLGFGRRAEHRQRGCAR